MAVTIEVATEVTPELLSAIRTLLQQLNFHVPLEQQTGLSEDHLRRVVAAPNTTLLIARGDDGQIVGMTSLSTFDVPTGRHAWIEDVVVDDSARGQGVGEALTRAALRRAGEVGAAQVDLTAAPYREAANRLYQRVGFQRRTTNVYRYDLRQPPAE
jgi:ribosomal protein S18 acetylase RimI-like enzyme